MKFFKTVDDIAEITGISSGLSEANIQANETPALNRYFYPVLGKPFCDALAAAYADTPPLSDINQELVEKLQFALANFMLMLWIPEGAVHISDTGISVYKSDSLLPASETKLAKLEKKYLMLGYDFLEDLLAYMEENQDEAELADWKASEAYLSLFKYFIHSASEFSDYVPISGRVTFKNLTQIMRKVEFFDIQKILGDDLYAELKEADQNRDASDDQKALLDKIKPALAHKTIARAVTELSLVQDETAIQIISSVNIPGINSYIMADDTTKSVIKNRHDADGNAYLKALFNYLEANTAKFPSYKAVGEILPYSAKSTDPFYIAGI